VASIEGYNLVISYYFSSSEIWPDNRGGLWWEGPYTVQYKPGTNVSL